MDITSNLSWLGWIVLGAIAGWIASMISGDNARQGWLGNIIVGIIGAFIGGLLLSVLRGGPVNMGLDIVSFITAIIGAIILLFILRLFQGR
jgi:uncharacterized membrane protein YeaQ/YmgE (transglycosylase-associated protein family)